MGLINQVVPAPDLLAAATALAAEVAANGPLGVQLTKRLMRNAVASGAKAGMATPEQNQRRLHQRGRREGATAFMEKRPAVFTGR